MTSVRPKTYEKLLRMLRIPKIDYFFTQIGRKMKDLWQKQIFSQCLLKTSTKCGGTLVKLKKFGNSAENVRTAPSLVVTTEG